MLDLVEGTDDGDGGVGDGDGGVGDGDRCGVVDNQGREIFADKMGVLVARDLLLDAQCLCVQQDRLV